jgi:predicted oxidoreductase
MFIAGILIFTASAYSQIPPPGYERAMAERKAMMQMAPLDRDSVTLVDTTEIFDPTTYESEIKIIVTTYSLRDYCREFLKINDPDMLLDHHPHTILDPNTFEDLIIRLNQAGKIDTLPK